MQGILYEDASVFTYLFVTVLAGGGGAWMTGRACANTWRPVAVLAVYALILTLGVRFIHFSIFGGTLLSLHYLVSDAAVLEIIAFLGYRLTKARLMVRQYYWLYEPAGPFGWKSRTG